MRLTIQPEPPDTADASALVGELDTYLNALYPPENRHGLSVAALQDESVVFLVARLDGAAAGCGAVRFVTGESDGSGAYAEVKRMYVRPAQRGLGVAQPLLTQLATLSQQHGVSILRLETGLYQTEAVRLYERAGFSRCAPFGQYADDGVSLCYEKPLAP